MVFFTILLFSFFLTFSENIIKLLNIKVFATKRSDASSVLEENLRRSREELQRVKNSVPAGAEYALFIKTMRAEKKIKELEQKMISERRMNELKSNALGVALNYVVKAILYIILVSLSIRNRYNPVLIFGEQFNLVPLQGLLTFPTGVPNAISAPMWVLSCNITFRLISRLIKQN